MLSMTMLHCQCDIAVYDRNACFSRWCVVWYYAILWPITHNIGRISVLRQCIIDGVPRQCDVHRSNCIIERIYHALLIASRTFTMYEQCNMIQIMCDLERVWRLYDDVFFVIEVRYVHDNVFLGIIVCWMFQGEYMIYIVNKQEVVKRYEYSCCLQIRDYCNPC